MTGIPPASPAPTEQTPKLVLQVPGSAAPLIISLDRPVLSLGRDPENDIVIDHPSISRRHAQLMLQGEWVTIQDLGSSNGTFINGERLAVGEAVTIPPGAEWYVGQIPARLHLAGFSEMPTKVAGAGQNLPTIPGAPTPRPKEKRSRRGLLAVLVGAALLLFLLFAGGAVLALSLLRQGQKRSLAACDQPPMRLAMQGGVIYDPALAAAAPSRGAANTTGPGAITPALPAAQPGQPQPILSTAFLELPFPFDGGNVNFGGTDAQFALASERNTGTGGRVNSYFDHYLPLYPAPKDPSSLGGEEPAEFPIGKNILPFDGLLNPYFSYSGHPALDYSTFVFRQPTTPVFAAADGVVYQVGTHGPTGALYVRIKHTVVGMGDFLTIYWHLNPDEYFNAMLGTEGQVVHAGQRIGTMGNTGHSTGHHLHFEVRFDRNADGIFAASEVVDPYGYIPSVEYPKDPWQARSNSQSNYLWIHPMGSVAQVGADGGGALPALGGTGGAVSAEDVTQPPASVCAQPGTLPPSSQVYYSWAPDPAPSDKTSGTGNGCVLAVVDSQGNPVTQFDHPMTIVVPFDSTDLQNVDPNTLAIYWQAASTEDWVALPTQLDFDQKIAVAQTSKPGKCSLMGKPVKDFLPPITAIEIAGAQAPDGSLYQAVTVKLSSSDPSGIKETYYSLDYGDTWKPYSGPFEVEPNGIPQPAVMDEEFFGGGPGRFTVLAYSVDQMGNAEDPPAYAYFSIDPSKNPDVTLTPSFTPTSTATPTFTPSPKAIFTATSTPTATSMTCDLTFTLAKNANCRKGPGTVYDTFTSFLSGQVLKVKARSEGELGQNTWFVVEEPTTKGQCWISAVVGTLSGDGACLKTAAAPPTPTPKPTPVPTPTYTPTPADTTPPPPPRPESPVNSEISCSTTAVLTWTAVNDPSGIDHYEWILQQMASGQVVATSSGSSANTKVQVDIPSCYAEYNWAVRAVDGARNASEYSPVVSFFVLD